MFLQLTVANFSTPPNSKWKRKASLQLLQPHLMISQRHHPRVAAAVRLRRSLVAQALPVQRVLQSLGRGRVGAEHLQAARAQALQLGTGHRGRNFHLTWDQFCQKSWVNQRTTQIQQKPWQSSEGFCSSTFFSPTLEVDISNINPTVPARVSHLAAPRTSRSSATAWRPNGASRGPCRPSTAPSATSSAPGWPLGPPRAAPTSPGKGCDLVTFWKQLVEIKDNIIWLSCLVHNAPFCWDS